MCIRENEPCSAQLNAVNVLAPLAGEWVRREQAGLLDRLDPGDSPENLVDVVQGHSSPERPPRTVRTTDDRMEIPVESVQSPTAQYVGAGTAGSDLGHDRHCLIDGGLDDHSGSHHTVSVDVFRDPEQRLIRKDKLLERKLALALDLGYDQHSDADSDAAIGKTAHAGNLRGGLNR